MSTSKHPAPGRAAPPRDDLETDPGIGSSRGATMAGEDPHILREDGENTEEGDVGNDADAAGKPTSLERHRTHR